ncbi:MAG: hypothetical protein ACT4PT_13930 [Methanobacteriota archaeon]
MKRTPRPAARRTGGFTRGALVLFFISGFLVFYALLMMADGGFAPGLGTAPRVGLGLLLAACGLIVFVRAFATGLIRRPLDPARHCGFCAADLPEPRPETCPNCGALLPGSSVPVPGKA